MGSFQTDQRSAGGSGSASPAGVKAPLYRRATASANAPNSRGRGLASASPEELPQSGAGPPMVSQHPEVAGGGCPHLAVDRREVVRRVGGLGRTEPGRRRRRRDRPPVDDEPHRVGAHLGHLVEAPRPGAARSHMPAESKITAFARSAATGRSGWRRTAARVRPQAPGQCFASGGGANRASGG